MFYHNPCMEHEYCNSVAQEIYDIWTSAGAEGQSKAWTEINKLFIYIMEISSNNVFKNGILEYFFEDDSSILVDSGNNLTVRD